MISLSKGELTRMRERDLLGQDKQKLLTGRTPEQTIADGNGSFVEFYGLNQSMKALFGLLSREMRDGVLWLRNEGVREFDENTGRATNFQSIDGLCLENAKLRKQVRQELGDVSTHEIEVEIAMRMVEKYRPGLAYREEMIVRVGQERADQVLIVGDPWHVTNKHIDEGRVQTIDYEEGTYAGAGSTETVGDVTGEIEEYLEQDMRPNSFSTALFELNESWGDIETGEDEDVDWLWNDRSLPEGFKPNSVTYKEIEEVVEWDDWDRELLGVETLAKLRPSTVDSEVRTVDEPMVFKHTVVDGYEVSIEEVEQVFGQVESGDVPVERVGMTYLVGMAERLSENLKTNPSTENLRRSQRAWELVQEKLKQNPRFGRPIDYDTSFGLHPMDNLLKSANLTSRNAAESIKVLRAYRDEIFPELIQKHLEELADIHVNAIVDGSAYDQDGLRWYRGIWNDFLSAKGIDPDKYQYYDPESHFVDLLSEFFLLHGIRTVGQLNPDFLDAVEAEKKAKVMDKFPPPKYEQEAEFTEMMFPQTQAIPANTKDRITMSWSWSAHMLKEMTREELETAVWPELDRLLASGGIANIFPIGHHGVDPEWVIDTVQEYIKQSGAKWEASIDKNVSHVSDGVDYRLLQIRKQS